jgi:hypothetical protein
MGVTAGSRQGDLLTPFLKARESGFVGLVDTQWAGDTFTVVR